MPGMEFEMQEADIAPDTLIFLFTDGLTEAEAALHQQFGEPRIIEVINQMFGEVTIQPQSLIDHMTDAVHDFVGDAEQSDDLTMMAVMRKA